MKNIKEKVAAGMSFILSAWLMYAVGKIVTWQTNKGPNGNTYYEPEPIFFVGIATIIIAETMLLSILWGED